MSTPNNNFRSRPTNSNTPIPASASEEELRRELDYTRDVLRRYREYVQTNYDRKLQESLEEVEILRQEVHEYQIENSELKKALGEAREGMHKANVGQDQAYKELRAELGQVLDQHAQHVDTLKRSHSQEVESAQKKISELEEEVKNLRKLADPDALRREANTEAQRKISHLERQLESERTQNQQTQKKLESAEAAQGLLTTVEKQLRSAVSNVHDLALDSHETSSQLGVGLTHAGVDAVSSDDLSSGWQKTLNIISMEEQERNNNSKNQEQRTNILTETLLAALLEVRRSVAQERSAISRGVRQLLGDKEAAEVELQRKEQVFQQELQLFQRRMTELEEDRYAEHHAANTAADRARHMDLLRDPRGAVTIADDDEDHEQEGGNSGSGKNGAPSRSQLMSYAASANDPFRSQHKTSSVAPQSVAPYYGNNNNNNNNGGMPSSSSSGHHRRTIAIQTGVELMLNNESSKNNTSSSNKNNNNTSTSGGGLAQPSQRLVAELEETQEQLTKAREVVRLLDMQRQQFMYFVEDPRLEEDIARALGAGSVATQDFVALSGKRFVHHTQ